MAKRSKNRSENKAPHNYRAAINKAAAAGKFDMVKPGTVQTLEIQHDDWCAIFKGGECNCSPTMELVIAPPDPLKPNKT